ncbi:cellulose synthase regulator BcsB [Pandoraea terrae]|uniref:Cyclic di-GMP-binding protein n=1 Tax=Pandoraea terrae TaxID=1537710 RepID=A0A5E4RYH9_9BURK|nr:cellulose biosynthesis cyclic di-GMP-binding regulatory protein BcsB [Pandoraea terrae]VVD68185.1 cellulose synthase regulator BcsB [Pandoraea terrae]
MRLGESWKLRAACLLSFAVATGGTVALAEMANAAPNTAAKPASATVPAVPGATESASSPLIAPSAGPTETTVTLAQLGQVNGLRLRGTEGSVDVNFGVRLDRGVTSAVLRLRYGYSPALLPQMSQLKVYLNEELVATLPYDKDNAGKNLMREIPLDPRLLSGFNRLRLVFLGHYTMECEDPMHSALWTDISPATEIVIGSQPLALDNDLAILPAPFFDRHDNRPLQVPFVFGALPSQAITHAAGVVATWLGALGDYRNARFPVAIGTLPARHAIVFATNDTRVAGLDLVPVDAPTLSMISHPGDPSVKLLVVQGRDAKDLETAALALVSGRAALSGASAKITSMQPLPRRPAYDAPRWIRTDRPVKIGELVNDPAELQVQGYSPWPIRVRLNLPADLLTWQNTGIPLDLRYRYTPPVKPDESSMAIEVNDQFVRAYRLKASGSSTDKSHMVVELLNDGTFADQQALLIPAFQVAARNFLSFQFAMAPHKENMCSQPVGSSARAAIDADSTVDFSTLPHYAQMPNLGFFANSGFPFTKYSDLAETTVVMSKAPDKAELETLFAMLGQMGKSTGVYANRFELADASQTDRMKDRDVLMIGGRDVGNLLAKWGKSLPLLIDQSRRVMSSVPQPVQRERGLGIAQAAELDGPVRLDAQTDGPLAALIGFESPLAPRRSVIALSATGPEVLQRVVDAVEDDVQRGNIHGDLAIMSAGRTEAFRLGDTYYVGDVSLWTRARFHLSQHPVLVALAALLAAFVIAIKCFGWLQRRAARRLEQ